MSDQTEEEGTLLFTMSGDRKTGQVVTTFTEAGRRWFGEDNMEAFLVWQAAKEESHEPASD